MHFPAIPAQKTALPTKLDLESEKQLKSASNVRMSRSRMSREINSSQRHATMLANLKSNLMVKNQQSRGQRISDADTFSREGNSCSVDLQMTGQAFTNLLKDKEQSEKKAKARAELKAAKAAKKEEKRM